MKIRTSVWSLPGLCLAAAACVQAAVPIVHLEKSATLDGNWLEVPATSLTTTPEGGLMDTADPQTVYYRLRIQKTGQDGTPAGFSLAEVPREALSIASEHLKGTGEEDWSNARLGPVAYPVYNPVINGGKEPAYLEFKVIPGKIASEPSDLSQSPPLEQKEDLGFILVSLTRQDVPIPEFSTEGPTRVEKLRRLAKTTQMRAVRYSQAVLLAENAQGEPVASLGATPFQLPDAILDFADKGTDSEVQEGKPVLEPDRPDFTGTPYESFKHFKEVYLKGTVYQYLRARQAQAAELAWMVQDGKGPELVKVPLKNTTVILPKQTILRFEVEDPTIVGLELVPKETGLKAVGLRAGATILTVIYPDGAGNHFLIQVGLGLKAIRAASWGSWNTYYAGGWGNQKRYSQEWGLAGCCANAWSGCGPTAWAMFYGYWDGRGVTSLIGGSGGTPMLNNGYVQECIRNVFGWVGTYCVNGQAATNPWQMNQGYRWAGRQGAGINISTTWGVPYLSSGPRNKAIQSIRDYGRPALVGTGFYEHYPLAFAYKYRDYTWLGITWDTQRYWLVNNGHAETAGIWVDAASCWFGSNGYCY